jgi:hypothetical protein
MRPAALAILLALCVPLQLLGQNSHASPPSSPSSSPGSSSSPSPNYGGGSSGGYSGGSSHSSGSTSSGGNAGGSHSSGSSGGYHSSGSTGSTNSSANSNGGASSRAASGGHSGATQSSAQSNVRNGNAGVERSNVQSGAGLQNGGVVSHPSSHAIPIQNEKFLQEAFQLHSSTSSPRTALREGKFDKELGDLGLARSKAAYYSSARGVKDPNWFSKHILGKQQKPEAGAVPSLRPCTGKECKPVPIPPKPCLAGTNCNSATQPTAPSRGVCASGVLGPGGACEPWGYLDCNRRGVCDAHLTSVDPSYCADILSRLRQEEMSAAVQENQRQTACSSGAQSPECLRLTNDTNVSRLRVEQLQRQYQMCRLSAGF